MKNKFINENTYLDASNDFVKELEKSKILADNIDVSVGPSQWGKPGELRFRDHVTLRAAGIETELYVIPRGSYTEFELYTDTGYDKGREVKVGDAKTIIKAMKRYVNKMNESMVDEASQDAYSLHILGDNLGQETAEEFLSNNNVDLKLLTKAIQQKTISKYELRDVVKGTAHKSKIKNFMKEFVKESNILTLESFVGEARAYKLKASEFGQNTMSAPYEVKGENGTWRVHSTYAIDQVSGNDNKDERDVVFFEVFPYSNNIVIKIGGIHNIGRTNASTYGTNFATTVEEFNEDPSGIAKEASKFLTDAIHLKWLNKNAKSEGQKIKWALKDDYSSVIEDLVNKSLGLSESVITEGKFKKGQTVKYIVPGTSNKMKSGKITDFKSTRDEDFAVIDGKTISFSNISESVNEGTDDVVFTIDDGNLDNKFLMTRSLSRNLDYQHDSGDQYYVLPKRDFDRLEDYADSHGYDADSIYVIEESVNEAEKYDLNFKIGDTVDLLDDKWEIIDDMKPNKKFKDPFTFQGKDLKQVPVYPPSTNKKAEGYKIKTVDGSPQYGFLYQYTGTNGKLYTKLATVGVNESVNEAKVKLPKGILKHKDIPTWAEWVAQHSDGEWTWYESYPNVVNFKDGGGAWKQEYPDGYQIYTGVKTDPKNWKEGPYRVRYDGDIVMESVNEEIHKTIAIEDSILQGIAEYLETTKGKLFKVINYDKRAARDLSELAKHLKPILDNWDEYGKVEEKLTQTFGDYLKDLDTRFEDGHKAAMGDNGGEQLENRQTALHNLRLFGNYIKSLLKEYGKDKTKLTFMKESRHVLTLESFVNEGKVDWNIIAKEVANRLKKGSWPWAIKNGVENITTENIGSVLISGGYTTTSGVEKNIGGVIDKVLALVKESFLNEELPTHEIDPNKFQNPYKSDKNFFKRGYKDDEVMDDVVKTRPVKIQASQLKPSQDAVYLGKALGMAIGGVEGGNLEAVISSDNRILDGHHRWAATIFNNPKARVGGVQAELKIGDLVPVLRQAGDALGNKRGLPPKGGDQNIFKATLDDVKDAIYDGKYMNPQFYNKDKAIAWFEEQGEKKIQSALNLLQRVGPPGGAPPRADMPKIEPEQVQQIAKKLQGGAIDVRAPYVKEELSHLTSLESFIDEKKPGPDPYMTDLSKDDEEDKEEQMKKQAAMDDDDPNAYKDMPGDKEAREKGDMKKSKHTSAYHKKFKKVKSLEEFANDWAVIKEGYNADAVAQNVVVALDSAAQFFPRYQPAEAEAEVKDVLKKYKKLQGKNAEKAAKEIRNSLEDRGLLANDILPLDVEIIIIDNLNESVNEEKDQTNDKSKIDGEGIETGLKKKAEESGVPIGIIRVIMRRGMAAWKSGHRPGTNSTQWGYARVNSFLTKGDGTWGKADKDMAKEVRDGNHDKKL